MLQKREQASKWGRNEEEEEEDVGLERGPLSLVRIIEELVERKVAAPV
jgi:hypothetical protein